MNGASVTAAGAAGQDAVGNGCGFAVFVSSSDAYADIWDVFFDHFVKFWPGYRGPVYLNTESATYRREGLEVVCTGVGRHRHFGAALHAGLDRVPHEAVLLLMIDYVFMAPVDEAKLARCYRAFREEALDTCCLCPQAYRRMSASRQAGLFSVRPLSNHMFSFQAGFWRKEVLRRMVAPHETPWTAEFYGTWRANLLPLRMSVTDAATAPIRYLPEGALRTGRWVRPMVDFLEAEGAAVDFARRGLFREEARPGLWRRVWNKILWSRGSLRSVAGILPLLLRKGAPRR